MSTPAAFELVEDDEAFAGVVGELEGAERYALDTEFHRERSYYPKVALVQIAWEGRLVLVDPLAVDVRPLARVLDGDGLAVVHAAEQDLEVLERSCGAVPRRLFDTQVAAGFAGYSSASLRTLVERLAGATVAKGDRLTDWTRRPLTRAQLAYAASDVEHLLALHDTLRARLDERGRLGWAEDECELLRIRPRGQEPETAWWRLKGARSLRGSARGVAQEVAAWREQRAAGRDIPPRFVLADLALTSIAERPPASERELGAVRGLNGRLNDSVAAEIMTAIGRGLALPASDLRLPPDDQLDRRLRPAIALVTSWLAQLADDVDLDPAVLATRSDVASLLRGDGDGRLARGWRRDLVAEPVARLVRGDAALAFADGRLVLEARRPPAPSTSGEATMAAGAPADQE